MSAPIFSGSPRYPSGIGPCCASQPISTSPGDRIRVRSSLTTTAPGLGANLPEALWVRLDTCPIWDPDSEEPPASRIVKCGNNSTNRCLSGALSAAPPVTRMNRPDRS